MKKELKLLLSGLLFAACTNVPQDDGTLPPPLYSQPQSAKANPEGGYITNRVTNDTIEPIINSFWIPYVFRVPILIKRRVLKFKLDKHNLTLPTCLEVTLIDNLQFLYRDQVITTYTSEHFKG